MKSKDSISPSLEFQVQQLRKQMLKTKVAGRSSTYVNETLENTNFDYYNHSDYDCKLEFIALELFQIITKKTLKWKRKAIVNFWFYLSNSDYGRDNLTFFSQTIHFSTAVSCLNSSATENTSSQKYVF